MQSFKYKFCLPKSRRWYAISTGDPSTFGNLNPPEQVLQAVRDSVESHSSRGYAPAKGHLEARQAVAEYSAHQGDIQPDDVILSSGASHAIELAISALADSGQNILVPRPGFMIYQTLAEGLGITTRFYNLLVSFYLPTITIAYGVCTANKYNNENWN